MRRREVREAGESEGWWGCEVAGFDVLLEGGFEGGAGEIGVAVAGFFEGFGPEGEGAGIVRGGRGAEAGDGVVGVGECPGFGGESGERVGGGEGGFAGGGGDGFEPEGVLLGLVEEKAGFDAGDDGFGPEVVEELGPGEDGRGFPGGQIAGALYGASGIPRSWIEKLALREFIDDQATRLADLARRVA